MHMRIAPYTCVSSTKPSRQNRIKLPRFDDRRCCLGQEFFQLLAATLTSPHHAPCATHPSLPTTPMALLLPGRIAGNIPGDTAPQEELNYEVLWELMPMFEEWAGVPLEPTSVYGVRVYQDGATLMGHLDVLETHVISGILHIDSDKDAPYPIQIEGGKGTLESYDLEPGDLFFYESAKCFHQRSIPLQGRHYASIFLHYRPVGWNMTRESVRFSIPPNWSDGVNRESERRLYNARSEEAQPAKADASGRISAEFVNERDHPVGLWWVDGSEIHHVAQVESGTTTKLTTTVGHRFVAKHTDQVFHRTRRRSQTHLASPLPHAHTLKRGRCSIRGHPLHSAAHLSAPTLARSAFHTLIFLQVLLPCRLAQTHGLHFDSLASKGDGEELAEWTVEHKHTTTPLVIPKDEL